MVLKIVAIGVLVIVGLAFAGSPVRGTTAVEQGPFLASFGAAMVPGAVRIWRLADGEFYRDRGERAEEEPAAGIADRRVGRGGVVLGGELGLRAFARGAGAGGDDHAGHGGDATGAGAAGRYVYRGGDCDLNHWDF